MVVTSDEIQHNILKGFSVFKKLFLRVHFMDTMKMALWLFFRCQSVQPCKVCGLTAPYFSASSIFYKTNGLGFGIEEMAYKSKIMVAFCHFLKIVCMLTVRKSYFPSSYEVFLKTECVQKYPKLLQRVQSCGREGRNGHCAFKKNWSHVVTTQTTMLRLECIIIIKDQIFQSIQSSPNV